MATASRPAAFPNARNRADSRDMLASLYSMRPEWDASAYHRLSDPQFQWGLRVLEKLAPTEDERILDVGCGSGRLTAELAARTGRVIAVDRSAAMLEQARAHL